MLCYKAGGGCRWKKKKKDPKVEDNHYDSHYHNDHEDVLVFFNYFAHCLFLLKAAIEAPDINYKSIKTTKIKLEDNAACNIGVHFDLVADKIGK